MSYKAIGFDYGGVIYGAPGSVMMQAAVDFLAVSIDTLRAVFFANNHYLNVEKSMSWVELWQHIAREADRSERQSDIARFIDEWDRNQVVDKNMIRLIGELRTNGYKIGLLSNYAEGLRERLTLQGIARCFDAIGISSEMGAMKPQPEAFLQFCDTLEVRPQELVFIDDSAKSLASAETVGYTPILFRSFDKLRHELSALGVIY
ncbi:MAG: HAD-IA family hydrolase [Candidatus Moranbacteria bacterium]|nr:HAD-IA family hydrolase [Candidatus Moranbacteria bacterium]